jgi:hypothetical protein
VSGRESACLRARSLAANPLNERESARLIRSASAARAPDARRVMQRPQHAGRADCIANFQPRLFILAVSTPEFFACSFLLIKSASSQLLTNALGKHSRRRGEEKFSAPVATLQNNYLLRRLLIYGLRRSARKQLQRTQTGKKMRFLRHRTLENFPQCRCGFLIRRAQTIEKERGWNCCGRGGAGMHGTTATHGILCAVCLFTINTPLG